jgi:cytoskeletal protein CcmA (bactofilin family)
MIKAGSLLYAIFLSVITSLICLMLIGLQGINTRNFHRVDQNSRLTDLVHSGIAQIRTSLPDYSQELITEHGSAQAKKRLWGHYEVLSSRSQNEFQTKSISYLAGYEYPDTNLALYQPNENNDLRLGGAAFIKGNARISSKGLNQASISGYPNTSSFIHEGKELIANPSLPGFPYSVSEYWSGYMNGHLKAFDSLIKPPIAAKYKHPFWKKTAVLRSTDQLNLSGVDWQGNLIIISEQSIVIDSTCRLNNVVLIAPEITVLTGVDAQVHLVAKDRIYIGRKVKLNYPSSLSLYRKQAEAGEIVIEENSTVQGGLIFKATLAQNSNHVHVLIKKNAQIFGTVYCTANCQLMGEIYGQVFSRYFIMSGKERIMEGLILEGSINRLDYPGQLLSFPLESEENSKQVLLCRV